MNDMYSLYDALPVGVLVIEGTGVVYANAAASSALGLEPSRLVGRDTHDVATEIVAPEQQERIVDALEAVLVRREQLPPTTWIHLSPPGGPERVARVVRSAGPRPGQTLVVILEMHAETVSRRLTEAMVVAANEFVRCREEQDILETAVEILYREGYWTAVLGWNGGKLNLLARRQDEGMLRKAVEILGIPEREVTWDAERIPHFQRLFSGRRAIFVPDAFVVMDEAHDPEVARMVRKLMPRMSMVDAPIFVGGEPFGFLSVQGMHLPPTSVGTIDLFARLIAGAIENVRHHRKANERLNELTTLQKELVARERLAALGEAAGVLSHEARNPLGAILNSLAVLRRIPALGEDGVMVLDIAQEEAFRLDWLVRDLMELARPLETRSRPLKLDGIFDAAVSDLRRRLGRSLPDFDVTGDHPLPEILADPTLFKVALENLLRNAAQIAGSAPVRVSMVLEAQNVVVGVDDPLPPTQREIPGEAFDPFSIVRPRGTGLGLAVVKRLVEAQGGAVRARNGGARIEIAMPVAAPGE